MDAVIIVHSRPVNIQTHRAAGIVEHRAECIRSLRRFAVKHTCFQIIDICVIVAVNRRDRSDIVRIGKGENAVNVFGNDIEMFDHIADGHSRPRCKAVFVQILGLNEYFAVRPQLYILAAVINGVAVCLRHILKMSRIAPSRAAAVLRNKHVAVAEMSCFEEFLPERRKIVVILADPASAEKVDIWRHKERNSGVNCGKTVKKHVHACCQPVNVALAVFFVVHL